MSTQNNQDQQICEELLYLYQLLKFLIRIFGFIGICPHFIRDLKKTNTYVTGLTQQYQLNKAKSVQFNHFLIRHFTVKGLEPERNL